MVQPGVRTVEQEPGSRARGIRRPGAVALRAPAELFREQGRAEAPETWRQNLEAA